MQRFRRLRMTETIRRMVREVELQLDDLITPVFVTEGFNVKSNTSAMPDFYTYSLDRLTEALDELSALGLKQLILFGVPGFKDGLGTQAYDENGIVQKAIKLIKQYDSSFYIITDVCLCQYTDHGHCGIINDQGEILNDETVKLISKIALSHVQAGADMVAPSDMMDGRIAGIRNILDQNGFEYIPIMAYSLKYCSNYYGPFRAVADSSPKFGSRKSYQMDYHNSKEAVDVAKADVEQGADFIMVKPAMIYLDIVKTISMSISKPVVVYNVSGEYAMLDQGVKTGIVSENIIYETMIAFKRAGASLIITYFSKDIARKLNQFKERG